MPAGRPTIYTRELGERICRAIATSTDSLAKICKDNGFPSRNAIYEWCFDFPEFGDMYDKAKRLQAARLAEEVVEIADFDVHDMVETEKGFVPNTAKVQRDRLRVDSRKWIACKLLPKVYGDKSQVEQNINATISHAQELKEVE